MTQPKQPIAIIGAGLAGVSCALQLQSVGHPVVVYEKSRGAAGRMSTRRSNDWQADHGAQYFTARGDAFQTKVDQWTSAGLISPWHARIGELTSFQPLEWSTKPGPTRYVSNPGMNSLVRSLADQLDLKINTTITRIEHGQDGWLLYSKEQDAALPAVQAVVFAIPAPQLVAFDSVLPDPWIAQASQTRFDPCWAGLVGFDQPLNLPFDALFINQGPLRWIARNHSKPGRTGSETWTLHASPEFSSQTIEHDGQEIQTELLAAFAQIKSVRPVWAQIHKWRYALSHTAGESGVPALWDAKLRLGVCGDWLVDGRIEGAWSSGQACAQRVIEAG
jgi:hypothetical protein